MWEPLVIGTLVGLLFGPVITRLFVPVLYRLLYRVQPIWKLIAGKALICS